MGFSLERGNSLWGNAINVPDAEGTKHGPNTVVVVITNCNIVMFSFAFGIAAQLQTLIVDWHTPGAKLDHLHRPHML